MPIVRKKHEADYIFKAGSYRDGQLRILRFHGTEALSQLFYFEVELAYDREINFDEIVGTPALITIYAKEGKRYVHALVGKFELAGKGKKYFSYRAELRPQLWFLTHKHDLRIFQEKSTVDILKLILNEHDISGDQVKFSLLKNYEQRQYCVQYRETDFAFISRLMEEEGIFYFFEHHEQKHTLVIGDDPAAHVPIEGPPTLTFRPPTQALIETREHIYSYSFSKELRSGAVKMKDFDFKKPRLNLETTARASDRAELEIYDYPGRYVTTERGSHFSRVKMEETRSTMQTGTGRSNCRRMCAGFTFTLDEYYLPEFNREYLITEVTHWGEETQALENEPGASSSDVRVYDNTFKCIPASVAFRPPRITPRALVHGTQTAIVVGPAGEEIYTDEHGRIKVQFHWDREGKNDEKSSCWIRVSQTWAGENWGTLFLPRIGQEVIVDFIEGDPDRPIVIGSVYNGEKKVPYNLPDEKTKSTIFSNSSKGGGGFNEIRFEDKKGEEEVFIHAQKDMTIKVENNRSMTIGSDDTLNVGHNRKETIKKDDDLDVKTGNKTIKVLQGTYELTAKDIKVKGLNSIEIVCGAGSIKFDAAGNISIKGPRLESMASILNDIKGTLVKINS
jgi:type VI secretion system secreted protein VgrG